MKHPVIQQIKDLKEEIHTFTQQQDKKLEEILKKLKKRLDK